METLQKFLLSVLPWLKTRATIAIIYAGNPSEPQTICFRTDNPRSWKSYKAVAIDIRGALIKQGFKHVVLLEENISLAANLNHYSIDFAWLNTAGVQGVDSACHCASLLESLGIPYVGHTPANLALMDNKHLFKMFLNSQDINTAPYITWHPKDLVPILKHHHFDKLLEAAEQTDSENASHKFIVKPVCGRASLNVHISNTVEALPALCEKVYNDTGNTVLIEPFLSGREYCVAVMGGVSDVSTGSNWNFVVSKAPLCFALFERVLPSPDAIFTSMDFSPITNDSVKPLHPENDAQLIADLTIIGQKIYNSMGLHNIIRIDLRMDNNSRLQVLEANPKPDLKAASNNSASIISLGLSDLNISYDRLIVNQLINSLTHLYYSRKSIASRLK